MALEGDRPIRIYYPDESQVLGWNSFAAWARRQDRSGRVQEVDDQRAGVWTTAFVIRTPLADHLFPMPDWRIRDERGEQYVIEDVHEMANTRGGRLRLLAFRSADAEVLPE